MVRTFVALLIPTEWAEFLGGIARGLAERTSGVSWVKPGNLHVTLRFLGDLGDSGVERAGEAVRRGVEGVPAFPAALGGLGGFPNLARPRVIWAGLTEGAEEATNLARSVNGALKDWGFGRPDKPFRAHLTLGRVREGARGLAALGECVLPPPPAPALLDRVALMKSELDPAGARYTPLLEVRLRR
ncbi:MAG TPA: RNA 2',3'-cyclic phosphodiesterase [Candidatus Eisenbacteria bacterium]